MLLDLTMGIRYDKRSQLQDSKFLSLPDELLCRVFDVMTDLDDIMALAITNSRLLRNAEPRIHSVYGSQKDRLIFLSPGFSENTPAPFPYNIITEEELRAIREAPACRNENEQPVSAQRQMPLNSAEFRDYVLRSFVAKPFPQILPQIIASGERYSDTEFTILSQLFGPIKPVTGGVGIPLVLNWDKREFLRVEAVEESFGVGTIVLLLTRYPSKKSSEELRGVLDSGRWCGHRLEIVYSEGDHLGSWSDATGAILKEIGKTLKIIGGWSFFGALLARSDIFVDSGANNM